MESRRRSPLARLLAALLLTSSCASSRAAVEPAPSAAPARYTYRAAVPAVPAGSATVRLGVRVPDAGPAGELRALSAFGIVGNAPFDVALPDTDSGELEHAHAHVTWRRVSDEKGAGREVVLESRGKPLELALRLAGASGEAEAVRAELAGHTWAEVDSRPLPAPVSRCERLP